MLDMRRLNQIRIHPESSTITVGAGATWHDIQKAIHPRFAIKSMQSTDIFTVGGSISVDAHGMDHRAGAVMNSLRSMRIMVADGRILTTSPTENTELFRLAVGGYGLFGIILSARHLVRTIRFGARLHSDTGPRLISAPPIVACRQSLPALTADPAWDRDEADRQATAKFRVSFDRLSAALNGWGRWNGEKSRQWLDAPLIDLGFGIWTREAMPATSGKVGQSG